MATTQLFDEMGGGGFQGHFREELRDAGTLDLALKRLRLTGIDIGEELDHVRSIRLVLARVSAAGLDAEAHALVARAEAGDRLGYFLRIIAEGRMRIRVAPLGGWYPDFSVFSDARGPRSVLLGFHQFETGQPLPGPVLAARFGRSGALLARRRFEEIWTRSHDVLPAIRTILSRAHESLNPPPQTRPRPVDTLRALG